MLFARKKELKILGEAYKSSKSEIVCVYGRRRIGKSKLINEFISGNFGYSFEGLEKENTSRQIQHFANRLAEQLDDELIRRAGFKDWDEAFTFLTQRVVTRKNQKKKIIIFFDELQWMAARQNKLISLIKYFWDNHWKETNVMLVLCGSVASFMIDKVLKSKALYGRINHEILLRQLNLEDSKKFFQGKRNDEEILKYLMIFGGVPKYLELINLNKSFKQNIEQLCFQSESYFVEEFEKIFYSQFRESQIYIDIVNLLQEKMYSFQEIANKLKIAKGGGLKRYLNNLEQAQFITSYMPSEQIFKTKTRKYRLNDEFLCFYFKYIRPNLNTIKKPDSRGLFTKLCETKWTPWLGLAFERLILKNAIYVADKMGFGDEVIDYSPFFARADNKFQIDLMYIRTGKICTIVEVKYHNSEITTSIIPEMDKKIKSLSLPKAYVVEKALISLKGSDRHLQESRYFDHELKLDELL